MTPACSCAQYEPTCAVHGEPRYRQPQPKHPRCFVLRRIEDESGVSGTGDVAWGCVFPDGTVVTRWCVTDVRQTCVWRSVEDVLKVHGHNGKTQLVYVVEVADG